MQEHIPDILKTIKSALDGYLESDNYDNQITVFIEEAIDDIYGSGTDILLAYKKAEALVIATIRHYVICEMNFSENVDRTKAKYRSNVSKLRVTYARGRKYENQN